MVANTVVEKVLCTQSLNSNLDLPSDCLKQLADATPNIMFACIWETDPLHKYGFCSIFQRRTRLVVAGVEEFLDYLGGFILH